MHVNRHAESALVALGAKLPEPASVVIARLKAMPAPAHSVALEVGRMTMSRGNKGKFLPAKNTYDGGTNGDCVIAIIREGRVVTVMLRRSWDQEFTPAVLRVDEVIRTLDNSQ